MNSPAALSDVVITTEHRRFAEFCDACRRYGYIGLCYGTPGVGKTLSARHYTNWNQVEAYSPSQCASDAELAAVMGSNTIFYTPKVVNWFCQLVEANIVTRQTGTLPQSSPPFRRPAPSL